MNNTVSVIYCETETDETLTYDTLSAGQQRLLDRLLVRFEQDQGVTEVVDIREARWLKRQLSLPLYVDLE